jgi:AcrR family transcriptional regulator
MARPPKFEERNEEIMRAFELCVARKGLAATTLTDIATEAGLPRSLVRYFMGNRDEMVDRLIERLMARAEASLSRVRDQAGAARLDGLLDQFFGEVFANELSNAVIGELWYLAKNDEHIRSRLNGVYNYAIELLAGAMQRERQGGSARQRRAAAFAILSLILGQSSLNDFGIFSGGAQDLRKAAEIILAQHGLAAGAKKS